MLSLRLKVAVAMAKKSESKRTRAPKAILKLPDLEQSKSAILNSLNLAQFSTFLRSCDSGIYRLVLFRATHGLQRNRRDSVPNIAGAAALRSVDS
jgi:hypothetical protein